MVDLAEKHELVVFTDEIYDQITYEGAEYTPVATLVKHTLCGTFSGLSKVYRSCGFRVGWLSFSGEKGSRARVHARPRHHHVAAPVLERGRSVGGADRARRLPVHLRPDQARRPALPNPRHRSRRRQAQQVPNVLPPRGAIYAFPGVDLTKLPNFDDEKFAIELLERKHVLIAPGSSFNVPYRNHFRITLLPDEKTMADVFERMEDLLDEYAAAV
jgi:alanine-synthesizing transaminase